MANFLSKLNVIRAVQNKFAKDALASAKAWLNDLDLDQDGKKDLEEIKEICEKLQAGIGRTIEAVDAEQLVKAMDAAEVFIKAGSALIDTSKTILDTDKAKVGVEILKDALSVSVKLVRDMAEELAAENAENSK